MFSFRQLAIRMMALTATLLGAASTARAGDPAASRHLATRSSISVTHVEWKTESSYADVIARFERQLGHFDPAVLKPLAQNDVDVPATERLITTQLGSSGFTIFAVFDPGSLLTLKGQHHMARQYLVGNPLYAAALAEHDLRAGLYAPLRILFFEDARGKTTIEYDLPSSLFSQYGNDQLTRGARQLDEKFEALIERSLR